MEETKSAGHFNLFPLFAFITGQRELPPLLESGQRTDYSRKIDEILDDPEHPVPGDKGGWYVWGRFNDAAWWESLYVGMTTKRKHSNLRTRLYDELREECVAMFATVYGRDAVLNARRDQYQRWKRKGHLDYFKDGKGVQRNLRKTGTHYIIWVATSQARDIAKVESALINLYRPAFNSKRPSVSERDILNPRVKEVDDKIQQRIEAMRGTFKI